MAAPTKAITKAEKRSRIDSFLKAWNAHDVDAIMEHTTADTVWTGPGTVGALHGREAARRYVQDAFTAFPDLHYPAEDLHAFTTDDPEVAFSSWTLTGTMTGPMAGFAPTGHVVRYRGVCEYRFRDGLIAEHHIEFDSAEMLTQLGLLPHSDALGYRAIIQAQHLLSRLRGLVSR